MTEKIDKAIIKEHLVSPLKTQWADTLSIVLDPSVSLAILATMVLMILKSWPNTNLHPAIDMFFNLIIALSSGVAGANFSNRWSKLNETSILITRGKSAIRGLTLLSRNIAAIDQRIKQYSDQLTPQNDNNDPRYQLFRFTYEELGAKCIALQEETINAIEEWQDIVPGATNLKTQIGVITQLTDRVAFLSKQEQRLNEKLSNDSNASEEQLKKLTDQLAETKQELRKVNAELSQQLNSQFNKLGGYIGGPAIVPGPFVSADSILARIAGNVTLAYGPRVENEGVGTLMLGEDYTLENGLLTKKFDSK